MYEAVTRGIRVRATPQYLEEESAPEDDRFFWAYTIDISNEGSETVQLRSRHWRITDADGHTEEVRGPGVVGETPVLKPGTNFRYTSGCPARHAVGHHGRQLPDDDGDGRAVQRRHPRVLARQPARQAQPQLKPIEGHAMSPSVSTAKELLARLVAFDTTSHKTNIPLIDFVEAYLAGARHREPSRADARTGSRPACSPPSARATRGGIALSGHTDVVPVAGQDWDTDPFTLVERDGKLYGRGTCDMKGYLACALAMVPDLKARKLKVPFHIAFSYDEEVGCTGVRPMIAELGKTLPRPRMVFVGEPSKMTVVDAHKGPVRWRVELTGPRRALEHAALRRQRHRLRRPPDRRACCAWRRS